MGRLKEHAIISWSFVMGLESKNKTKVQVLKHSVSVLDYEIRLTFTLKLSGGHNLACSVLLLAKYFPVLYCEGD